jgi:hypothetical protein
MTKLINIRRYMLLNKTGHAIGLKRPYKAENRSLHNSTPSLQPSRRFIDAWIYTRKTLAASVFSV